VDKDRVVFKRREFLRQLGGLGTALLLKPRVVIAAERPAITKPIPATGERLPVIGMGSWITFDVGSNSFERAARAKVLQAFFDNGGALIDSSPMYGSSEEVIGEGLKTRMNKDKLFAATKVWILGKKSGSRQMETSQKLWGVPRFDLIQIHNMLDWETHWETLKEWKTAGRVRYVGITTSHGRRHDDLAKAMAKIPFDFVQVTYNLEDREVEQRLLPLAAERNMAVIINRPFDGGSLFSRVRGKPLPPWAVEFDCHSWAQYFLKFIVSHPAVTCAIPATSKVDHMVENMGAGFGRLPDAAMRKRMIDYFERLSNHGTVGVSGSP
jgi:diketogulonate reductase-like aldo/keto reductase